MNTNTATLTGNVVRTPELKFLGNGQASTRFSIAVNRRWQNKQTNEWEERVSYFDIQAYGTLAENVANSIDKGNRVTVTGRFEQRSWETPEGDKRSVIELVVDDVAASLAYATVSVIANESNKRLVDTTTRTSPRGASVMEDAF